MGVKTKISLAQLNTLFKNYNFTKLEATTEGNVDTTYIVSTKTQSYILKKYEYATQTKVKEDCQLLDALKKANLNVSQCREHQKGWYLYEKLQGTTPKLVQLYHIQALARFLSQMHKVTQGAKASTLFYESYEVASLLKKTKKQNYFYYKKLQSLSHYQPKHDGIIHGDIFKDNTVFDGMKIGVFDFIDAGRGSFVFDIAVALVGFGVEERHTSFIGCFLNTYNQGTHIKISQDALKSTMQIARKFYALLRLNHPDLKSRAKELL